MMFKKILCKTCDKHRFCTHFSTNQINYSCHMPWCMHGDIQSDLWHAISSNMLRILRIFCLVNGRKVLADIMWTRHVVVWRREKILWFRWIIAMLSQKLSINSPSKLSLFFINWFFKHFFSSVSISLSFISFLLYCWFHIFIKINWLNNRILWFDIIKYSFSPTFHCHFWRIKLGIKIKVTDWVYNESLIEANGQCLYSCWFL